MCPMVETVQLRFNCLFGSGAMKKHLLGGTNL